MLIDYSKIDLRVASSVKAVENKPHVRYIRYLITKRYSPSSIRLELQRVGLSSPNETVITKYYLEVIDPIVKQFGLGELYSGYKSKLLSKNQRCAFSKNILNYRIDIGDNPELQTKFCKFVKFVETDTLWCSEIYRFHQIAQNMPVDENGDKIIDTTQSFSSTDKILTSEKRYLVDKMIVEGLNNSRISEYCRNTLKIQVYDYDVRLYKKIFFNIQCQNLEQKLKLLEIEKQSLEEFLKTFDVTSEDEDLGIGEKAVIKKQSERRIEELNGSIKTLNAMFTDNAQNLASLEGADFEMIFSDIVLRAYDRFRKLDSYADRDVVDGLAKVAKIMISSHDKVEQIMKESRGNPGTDRSSQAVIMELVKKRTDEIAEEELNRANAALAKFGNEPLDPDINLDDIGGIEEVGSSYDPQQKKSQETEVEEETEE